MHRFQRLSASVQTIKAQLFPHERIIEEKDNVGLYDGKERSAAFDNGRVYLTNHRLIYLDAAEPYRNSRCIDLQHVKQTEYWVGFMKSSPKITLALSDDKQDADGNGGSANDSDLDMEGFHPAAQSWTCHVCAYRNNASSGDKCTLCGVPRSAVKSPSNAGSSRPRSSEQSHSAASSRPHSPAPASSSDALISCPACTYSNHPSMHRCEMCETPLTNFDSRTRQLSTPSRPASPAPSLKPGQLTPAFVKLSFRKGGVQVFYAALKIALQSKEWDNSKHNKRDIGSKLDGGPHQLATFGIDGILRSIDVDARDREEDMQEALSDLDALRKRAQDMVRMAEAFNSKLSSTDAADDAAAVRAVTQSLKSLGLEAPVVSVSGNLEDQHYHRDLAKELGAVLLGGSQASQRSTTAGLMVEGDPSKELIGLDEVWCMWNRIRGVALVSPQDLRNASQYLSEYTRPQIAHMVLKSGLHVLHLPNFSPSQFGVRLRASLLETDDILLVGLTASEVARQEGISVMLAEQMLEVLEDMDKPSIVRDEGDQKSGIRWQLNFFAELENQEGR